MNLWKKWIYYFDGAFKLDARINEKRCEICYNLI